MKLVILSFLCVVFLAVLGPTKRVRRRIPNLALVLWMTMYNLIHAIDAILWAGNVNTHIPVWCDIVTKLMLGATVALPGAFLCIAIELERVSSSRCLFSDKESVRNRMILEISLCYVVPLLYMTLHLVAQDRRFDLVEDYGCFPSTHPSTLAFLIIWIPALMLSGVAFVFYGISIHNIGVLRGTYLTAHLEARSTMNSSIFYRRLSAGMIMTAALILISLSSLFSLHSFQPWTSWNTVHALMYKIQVLNSSDDLSSIQFSWWAYFAISCLYIFLSFSIGEEARDIYRALMVCWSRKKDVARLMLPSHISKRDMICPKVTSHSPPPEAHSLTTELKSEWKDKWNNKPVRKNSKRSDRSLSPPCSPSSVEGSVTDDDLEFMSSTLSYLGSPTAKSLGITPPLQLPPRAKTPPSRSAFELPPKPSSPPPLPKPSHKPRRDVPEDVEPSIKSVFDVAWPIPPASPTPSPPNSYRSTRSRSRSHSPAYTEEAVPRPLYPTVLPPGARSRPFENSYVASSTDGNISPSIRSSARKTVPKRPSLRSLRRTWSKERLEETTPEMIHMTVVRETV